MTKIQKVWLWISLAMFVVPEVLWGGLASTFLNFKPILDFSGLFEKYPLAANILVLPHVVGLIGLLVLNHQCQKNKFIKYIIGMFLFMMLVVFLYLIYVSYEFTYYASFP
jgi:hypothetical protein